MNRALLLRIHRWLALAFSAPLLAVIVTGLILSFEPAAQWSAASSGKLPSARLSELLAKADPDGKARALSVRAYENTLSVAMPGDEGSDLDLTTGEETEEGRDALSDLFGESRRIHEALIFDLRWLVTASTIAMLIVIALGVSMGWPRFRNNVAGWHKGVAWGLLPLIAISPLSGLAIAFGFTFAAPSPAAAPPKLAEAISVLGRQFDDLSGLTSLRLRGGRMLARLYERGELRAYVVGKDAAAPAPRNWPRLIHEGNWGGVWSSALNVVTSIALLMLLATGLWIWARRKLRRRPDRALSGAAAPAE